MKQVVRKLASPAAAIVGVHTTPQALKIETVGSEQVVEDATRRMELYHIDGNPHARRATA